MFVALGMAAKVIVIIENQNGFIWPVLLAVKDSGGQATQPGANDDQIVVLTRLFRSTRLVSGIPGALMRHGIGSGVTPSESRKCWGIMRPAATQGQTGEATGHRPSDRDGRSVDEIPASNVCHRRPVNC